MFTAMFTKFCFENRKSQSEKHLVTNIITSPFGAIEQNLSL